MPSSSSGGVYRVNLDIRADGSTAVRTIRKVADEAQNTSNRVRKSNEQIDSSFKSVSQHAERTRSSIGSLAGMVGFGGLALGIKGAVQGAMSFQSQMATLQTQAGASAAQVKQMTGAVTDLAGKVGIDPTGLATGLYHLVSSMNSTLPPSQRFGAEMNALKIAAEGARVGHANLEDVTNALGAAIASGVRGVKSYSQAMGALNSTVGAGDMHMQDLAEAFGTGLLGPMKRFGLGIKDVGAALAVFGDNNIRGADAGTKLASPIRIMAAPSGQAAKWLNAIHMGQLQMAQDMRKPDGILVALEDFRNHIAALSPSQQGLVTSEIFGGKQSTGVTMMLGQLDRLRDKYTQVGAGMNSFGASWAVTNKTPAQQMANFNAQMKAIEDTVGLRLIPVIGRLATDLGWAATAFGKLPGPLQAGIVGFGALGILMAPLRNSFSLLKDTVDGVKWAMRLLTGSTEAATAAERVNAGANTAGGVETAGGGALAAGGAAAGGLGLAGVGLAGLAAVGAVGAGYGFGRLLGGAHNGVARHQDTTGLSPRLGSLGVGVVHRAMGGPVGTDTVPAWLTPGEYVLNRQAVQSIGINQLNAMNQTGRMAGDEGAQPIVLYATFTLPGGRVLAEEVLHFSQKRAALA